MLMLDENYLNRIKKYKKKILVNYLYLYKRGIKFSNLLNFTFYIKLLLDKKSFKNRATRYLLQYCFYIFKKLNANKRYKHAFR